MPDCRLGKEQVKAAVFAGDSGTAIAVRFGLSVQSVRNIKKEFGLVARKQETPSSA
jgi:transposase